MSARLWRWSKDAIRRFVAAADRGTGQFHIPSGLDAALAADLDALAPTLVRTWVEFVTRTQRTLTMVLPPAAYSTNGNGMIEVRVLLTKELLLDLLELPEPTHGKAKDTTAPPGEPPAPEGGAHGEQLRLL